MSTSLASPESPQNEALTQEAERVYSILRKGKIEGYAGFYALAEARSALMSVGVPQDELVTEPDSNSVFKHMRPTLFLKKDGRPLTFNRFNGPVGKSEFITLLVTDISIVIRQWVSESLSRLPKDLPRLENISPLIRE